jgi:hypothetical protein
MVTSFDIILPTIGATVIFFAVIYQKEVVQENSINQLPFICLLFIILTIYPIHAQIRNLNNDEYEHMHKAWLMLQGAVPFFSHKMLHGPLVNWIVALLIRIYGENVSVIETARQIMYILSLLSLFVIYLITKELFYNKTVSYIAPIFVTTNFIWFYKAYEIRPDNIMLFFALVSFLFLIKYHKTSYGRYLILFFLAALLSTLGKQNSAVFYFALLIAFGYNVLFRKRRYRLHFLAGIFVIVLTILLVPLFRDFFYVNISRHLVPSDEKFLPTYFLKQVIFFNPLFFAMFFSHFLLQSKITYSDYVFRDYIYSVILTSFIFLFFMNRPWKQEMLIMTVFMCIVTAGSIAPLIHKYNIKLTYICVGLLISMLSFFSASKQIILRSNKQLFEQVQITQSLVHISTCEDAVFDSYGKAIFRHHPFDPEFTNFQPEKFARFEELKSSNFRFLIKDEYYDRLPEKVLIWFDENFIRSVIDPNIFVRKNDIVN